MTEKQTNIRQRLLSIFVAAGNESFEDGMVSDLSIRIDRLIEQHGKAAIDEIDHLIACRTASDTIAGEVFRSMGKLDDVDTHDYRLELLKKSLSCSSAYLRDSAELGLESMSSEVVN